MQPGSPLSPGEIYYDEDLGIEVVAVESNGCSYPPRRYEPDVEKRIKCAYYGRCKTIHSCIAPRPPQPRHRVLTQAAVRDVQTHAACDLIPPFRQSGSNHETSSLHPS